MSKLFKENGMLSEYGEDTFAQFLDGEIITLLNDAENENELRIISSLIMQRVSSLTTNHMMARKKLANKFAGMTDEQFEEFLQEKYGDNWAFKTLTPAELDRAPHLSQEKIKKLLKEGAKHVTKFPNNGIRLPRKCKKCY